MGPTTSLKAALLATSILLGGLAAPAAVAVAIWGMPSVTHSIVP
jgi:hypothetical protein